MDHQAGDKLRDDEKEMQFCPDKFISSLSRWKADLNNTLNFRSYFQENILHTYHEANSGNEVWVRAMSYVEAVPYRHHRKDGYCNVHRNTE
jgi:hypothetical protein